MFLPRYILSPLDTLTTVIQGPDSTLDSVVTLSHAAYQCVVELRSNLTTVFSDAVQLANDNGIDNEITAQRSRKVSRRIDSGTNEATLSASDELKREMAEIIDTVLSELKSRFYDTAGRLYDLAAALVNTDTLSDNLRGHIEILYPDAVDVDLAVRQFEIVRHIPAWMSASTLQQRTLACPPSMIELRKLYRLLITVPVTSAECERTFSKLALIKNKLRTTCGQERLENLVLCSVERDIVQQVDIEQIIDNFAVQCNNRRIRLK